MAFETKKDRSGDENDVWEALLTRRLANELDAFLEETDDETFLFADETNAPRPIERNGKRRRFRALATVAASLAFLAGVATTARFYVASPKTENLGVQSRPISDNSSLIAWSVESFNETEWARHIETKWVSADVFERYGLSEAGTTPPEQERSDVEENALAEKETSEVDSNEWFSVEKLTDVAAWNPLKYEPFLQAVAASLL